MRDTLATDGSNGAALYRHASSLDLSTDSGGEIAAAGASMPIYAFNPLFDSRWADLVATHPGASAFHRTAWLKTLAATYGYRPIVVTSTPPGSPLTDGIVFCEIESWITGRRLVSLPFSDHAEPLLNENYDSSALIQWMTAACGKYRWKYIELRPLSVQMDWGAVLAPSQSFWFHTLDLAPSPELLFRNLHKNCLQRRIRKAEREQLSYERGRSDRILEEFFRLLMITRRRHRLLPQPRVWFRNMRAFMGPDMEIRLARKDGVPIAAILTLRHNRTVIYKYGCSDARSHHLAAMPLLFWRLIEESRAEGAEQIDFGRTDLDNEGLVEFKDRFGTRRSRLTYLRYPENAQGATEVASRLPAARRIFSCLPNVLSSTMGRIAYRHLG